MIWWYTIWPGWLGYASELFNGLITLPLLLVVQMGLIWLWNRLVERPRTERMIAAKVAEHLRLGAGRCGDPSRPVTLFPGLLPQPQFCGLTAGHIGWHRCGKTEWAP